MQTQPATRNSNSNPMVSKADRKAGKANPLGGVKPVGVEPTTTTAEALAEKADAEKAERDAAELASKADAEKAEKARIDAEKRDAEKADAEKAEKDDAETGRKPVDQRDASSFVDDNGRPRPGLKPDAVRDSDKPASAIAFDRALATAESAARHFLASAEKARAMAATSAETSALVSNRRVWSRLPNLATYVWGAGDSLLAEIGRFGADQKKAQKKAEKDAETERKLVAKLAEINGRRSAAGKTPLTIDDIRDMFA